ncbi:MAG TPA: metallophosphoesterase, partial [Gemmatimonadaceae bacterium]|nr:metallophosphoesterase [Gemmatimonadaceae bacterium]
AVFGGTAALVAVAIWGYVGSRRLVVKRVVLQPPRLPTALDGLTIVQLTDLHVGPHTPRGFLRRVGALTRDAEPHLVVVTGDLVDDFPRDVDHYARAFSDLAAPLGVFATPGNHDVYAGWREVRERLDRLPLTVLVNEARTLEWRGARFTLLGTGDPAGGTRTATGGVDLRAALEGAGGDAPVIALAHNPTLWPPLARAGVALTLSGHTHWGQFALPRLGWSLASVFLPHGMGAHRDDDTLLWIHPGTNYWGIPFRLGTPPEVVVLTLRHGEAAELRGAPAPERTAG